MSMEDTVLETENLTKIYEDERVVNRLNVAVKRGKIYGFLGPNGAGKTTTIRMILGLIRPTEGSVRIFGKSLPQHRLSILGRVGSLVETPSYYGHLTGYENLEVVRRLCRTPDRKRIDEVLAMVGLTDSKDKKVKNYSLGMKQRLGIAAALLNQPDLLILDEPTNGLDPSGIQEVRELIRRMPQENEVTVFVSSHLLSEVEQIATDVGILHRGRLLFQGSLQALRSRHGERLIIEVDRPEEAARLLIRRGIEVNQEGNALYVRNPSPSAAGEIQQLLNREGYLIRRLARDEPSLEQVFLEMVGTGANAS
jgi:ABC-2 type transport system ATP-binding protein